jgi:hypothetical protein
MHSTIAQASWTSLFTDRDLFQRLWRGALLQFMAQMCGATAIKYYLPTIFTALGLSKDLSLMASGIESTLKIGCTIMEMFLVDRVGRRGTLLMGSAIMSVAMVVCFKQTYPLQFYVSFLSTDIWSCRSTAPYPLPTPTTKTALQTTLAWSLYSFIHLAILLDLDRMHGFMELRYFYFLLLPPCLELTHHRFSQRTSVQKASTSVPVQVQSALLLLLNSTLLLCPTLVPKHISYFSVSTRCHLL